MATTPPVVIVAFFLLMPAAMVIKAEEKPNKASADIIAEAAEITRLKAAAEKLLPGANDPGEVKPPFNLQWGVPEKKLEALLGTSKATIASRKTEGGNESWLIHDLVSAAGVPDIKFDFTKQALIRVTLEYQRDDWDRTKYRKKFDDLKTAIDKKYGEPMEQDDHDPNSAQRLTWPRSKTYLALRLIPADEKQALRIHLIYSVK